LSNILDDWTAYGGSAGELQKIAWRITGLYCSASGYDRNWTMFECVSAPTTINKTQACDFFSYPSGNNSLLAIFVFVCILDQYHIYKPVREEEIGGLCFHSIQPADGK
jgi:hypothetical protein